MPFARAQMKGPVNSAPESRFTIPNTLGDRPPQSCSETSPTRTANLLRANCRRLSRETLLFVSTQVGRNCLARRTVYGAHMLPQTTDFGVTPDEARALHKKQHESDSKMAEYIIDFFQPRGIRSKGKNATVFYPQGSPTVASAQSQAAAEDAAIQEEDGIFDGGPTKDFGTTGDDNPGNLI
ncbi:hypothetical protein IWW34DRAFT_798987 [Fusarium oxysporum f. sp. albedinis]|nr:hypothetical protein IWW34DRAFT_798987 [Fusarium oxysporum f. sp. albedinis]